MPQPHSGPPVSPQPERAGMVGSPQPVCVVCGGPRELGKREACSNKCRAALTRQRQAERLQLRNAEILALLEHAERLEGRAAALRAQARQHLRT